MESLRLRIQDIDFGQGQLFVRGGKESVTFLPRILINESYHLHFILADSKTVGQTPKLVVSTMWTFILRVLIVQIQMQSHRYPPVVTTWGCIYGKKDILYIKSFACFVGHPVFVFPSFPL